MTDLRATQCHRHDSSKYQDTMTRQFVQRFGRNGVEAIEWIHRWPPLGDLGTPLHRHRRRRRVRTARCSRDFAAPTVLPLRQPLPEAHAEYYLGPLSPDARPAAHRRAVERVPSARMANVLG